ncbi:MAG: hypothetical protein DI538_14490 [Azospira oryzae]|nr:MAG: hypothetical protein DI538_14490 [Azospira oryzae]
MTCTHWFFDLGGAYSWAGFSAYSLNYFSLVSGLAAPSFWNVLFTLNNFLFFKYASYTTGRVIYRNYKEED